jgi:GNAT superfamily N-acetyltransferase
MSSHSGVAAVLSAVPPGSAVVVTDAGIRAGLLERGAVQVRHLFAMKRGLAALPDEPLIPGLHLRPWRDGDGELLAPALVAAYGADHPDPATPDLVIAARSLEAAAHDSDNPRLPATTVADFDGRAMGTALVLSSEHITGWKGPWLMNIFRAPAPVVPGVGRALLLRALHVLRENGESTLGLAVTASNPARALYERLGFVSHFEGWVLLLPQADHPVV